MASLYRRTGNRICWPRVAGTLTIVLVTGTVGLAAASSAAVRPTALPAVAGAPAATPRPSAPWRPTRPSHVAPKLRRRPPARTVRQSVVAPPRPVPVPHAPARPDSGTAIAARTGPTGWAQLDAAIARIPAAREAHWYVSAAWGFWGTADWYHDAIYVAPTVPPDRLYDVAVHEWSHLLSVRDYAGDVSAAIVAMNRVFGGTDLVGPERAADCMAIEQGATWTDYTPCADSGWRAAAARLVAGERL